MNRTEIINRIIPILKKYPISKAGLFGSYARNTSSNDSDLDLLVELQKDISLLEFIAIKQTLEDKLRINVDLVEYRSLKRALKDQILAEEVRIYG